MSSIFLASGGVLPLPTWPGWSDPSTQNTKFDDPVVGTTATNVDDMCFDGTNLITSTRKTTSVINCLINIHSGVSATISSSFAAVSNSVPAYITIITGGNLAVLQGTTVRVYVGVSSTQDYTISLDGIGGAGGPMSFNGRDLVVCNGSEIVVYKGLSGKVKATFTSGVNGVIWNGSQYLIGGSSDVTTYSQINAIPTASTGSISTPGTDNNALAFCGTNMLSNDATTNQIYVHPGLAAYAGP